MEMLDALKRTFQKVPQSSIGICRKGGRVFLAWLNRMEEEWQLSAVEEIQLSMDAGEGKAFFPGQCMQHQQEGYRIGAPGYGRPDAAGRSRGAVG